MLFEEESVGSDIMEVITSGLYDGNLNCLREYVQNGVDAKAANIRIDFENDGNDLVIRDDGNGMDRDELNSAFHVGKSNKGEDEVGWRGIGIWSGVPACRRIVVITKKRGCSKLRVQVNCDRLREQMGTNDPVTVVLTKSTGEIEILPLGTDEDNDSHFTEIRLESILRTQKHIFLKKEIYEHLARTIPAPLNYDVFEPAQEIDNRLERAGVRFSSIRVTSCGDIVFRPPTTSEPFFDDITWKEFKVDDRVVAIGWFLTTDKNAIVKGPNSGIFFKKKGFTIGDSALVIKQASVIYNAWQYGEIHILAKELVENAPRNNFEYNNDTIELFLDQVGDFVTQLQEMNRYQSGRMAPSLLNKAKKDLEKGDLNGARVKRDNIAKKLARTQSYPKDEALQEMRSVIDSTAAKHVEELDRLLNGESLKRDEATPPKTPDSVDLAKAYLQQVLNSAHPEIKKELRKRNSSGKEEFAMMSTTALKNILQRKTGLTTNEINELTREAYDWDAVNGKNGRDPLLTMAGPLDGLKKDCNAAKRNRRFGVLAYAVFDLMDNMSKHNSGKPEYAWFEGASEEEKYYLRADLYMMLDFVCRVVEKSKPFKP